MKLQNQTCARLLLTLIAIFSTRVCAGGSVNHIFGDPRSVQRAPQRIYHVQNYRLVLHFDELKDEVFGDEVVTLEPLIGGFNRFYLDSTGLTIDAVTLEKNGGHDISLPFEMEDPRLWISLDRFYGPQDRLSVRIIYHGVPRTGLFFVNPNAAYAHWPREIWSQGEPEFNHYWFPCWDYPNDMSTSEVIATVPDGQSVLSNGRLVKVTHQAGRTTYDWVESLPHSSYLTSIAVGPWRKVADHEGALPVDYYVPRSVDVATARRSFHLTPDMIGFYSRAFGVPYPYEQYAQVVVQNYPFGGMENISATTLTASTLHAAGGEPELSSQALVAHELGQQWFGDLVQGRDWANIWLNEGFATYLEALYTQYHDGNDAFRYEMWQDQLAAERQDREDYLRPIVDLESTDFAEGCATSRRSVSGIEGMGCAAEGLDFSLPGETQGLR
ncbi:MAG: M1 family metallopeptidase, partial [Steroidobacteraceae bacterium]